MQGAARGKARPCARPWSGSSGSSSQQYAPAIPRRRKARGRIERPRAAGGEPSGLRQCWPVSAFPMAACDIPWVAILVYSGSARVRPPLPRSLRPPFPRSIPFLPRKEPHGWRSPRLPCPRAIPLLPRKEPHRWRTSRAHCAIESKPPTELTRWGRLIAAMAREVGRHRSRGSRRRAPVESGASKRWRRVARRCRVCRQSVGR